MTDAAAIVAEIARKHGLEPWMLRRDMPHTRHYAKPRGEASIRLKDELNWSDSEIGRYFGGFHASTILHCRRIAVQPARPQGGGRRKRTLDTAINQIWELRRRIEWLEQRAGLPPIKMFGKRDTASITPLTERRQA